MARRGPLIEVDSKATRKALRAVDGGLDDLKEANREVGQIVATRAEQLVPVRSGALRGSIRAGRRVSGAIVQSGGRLLPYAPVIHFGWPARNIEPQPFLYDAADDRRDEVAARYDAAVADLIRKYDRAPG